MWFGTVDRMRFYLPRRPTVDHDLVRIGRLVVVMVGATVVAGTVVTGSGPHSGANSTDGRVARWHLNLHRVTQIHGAVAMLTLAVVAVTWWLLRTHAAPAEAGRRLQHLVEALAAQIALGYTQYFSGVPALLVAFHVLGAVMVWVFALRFALYMASGGELPAPAAAVPAGVSASREPAPA